jgi:hypothetical protein
LKKTKPKVYGMLAFKSIALIGGRLMENLDFPVFNSYIKENKYIEEFIKYGRYSEGVSLSTIYDHLNNYIRGE